MNCSNHSRIWVMALALIVLPVTQGFKIPLEHYSCPEDVPHCHDNDVEGRNPFMTMDNRLPQEYDPLFLGVLRSYVDALLEPLEQRDSQELRPIHPSLPAFCGRAPLGHALSVQRIVGGEEAKTGQFPWQAQLLVRKPQKNNRLYFQCGATLISDELLITASHCIKVIDASLYTVILGKHGYDSAPACDEQRFEVRKIVVHPQFNKRTLLNDITLLWIRTPWNQTARYTEYIQPACLPDADDRDLYEAGSVGQVSGWGLMDESDRTSAAHFLQHVGVPITTHTVCSKSYQHRVVINAEKQFCAGNDKKQDACAGDSGGPFVRIVGGRITLVGVYIGCEIGQKIQIVSAFYGRKDANTCSGGSARSSFQSFAAYNCQLENVRFYVDKQCNGKTGCWFYHGLFREDPCPYLSKYAIISFRCVDQATVM
eukprot:TCALIF_11249-PA protein Name:"Similar to F2 Prothrombin (Sus scrofa)" AED:0.15 eAED:0.15 QI:0/0/0/0.5/1/1/2/0/425